MTTKYFEVTCPNCGIDFQIPKKMEDIWRGSGKSFHCPNGHGMGWTPPTDDDFKKEIKSLKQKLKTAEEKIASQTTRIEELENEIEIWKPSDKTESK